MKILHRNEDIPYPNEKTCAILIFIKFPQGNDLGGFTTMKKLTALAIALIMALTLAACSGNGGAW
jgi:hypothetical protein